MGASGYVTVATAEERLNALIGGNEVSLTLVAARDGRFRLGFSFPARVISDDGREVIALFLELDGSSATPVTDFVHLDETPLIYWRYYNDGIDELVAIEEALLTAEGERNASAAATVRAFWQQLQTATPTN